MNWLILKLGILRDKREDDPFHLDAPVKLARENYVTTRQRREVTNFNRFQIHDWAKNMYKCRGWQKMRLLLMTRNQAFTLFYKYSFFYNFVEEFLVVPQINSGAAA